MKQSALALVVLVLAGCTSTKPVDMKEPRRMVGTENDVRVDAEIYGDQLTPNVNIALKYDITNNRSSTILIADLLPQATYDQDSRTVTVDIGSEIPGEEFLPRLVSIPSGGKKSFSTGARISIVVPPNSPWAPRPSALRIRVNFLGDAKPFEKLIDISERAVHDRQLAAELFPKWVDGNETVTTNALPMHWSATGSSATDNAPETPAQRRRRGRG